MNFEWYAFVGSVAACLAVTKVRQNNKNDKNSEGSFKDSQSVLLLIHVPQAGNNPLATIVNNDEIITKVVKGIYILDAILIMRQKTFIAFVSLFDQESEVPVAKFFRTSPMCMLSCGMK